MVKTFEQLLRNRCKAIRLLAAGELLHIPTGYAVAVNMHYGLIAFAPTFEELYDDERLDPYCDGHGGFFDFSIRTPARFTRKSLGKADPKMKESENQCPQNKKESIDDYCK